MRGDFNIHLNLKQDSSKESVMALLNTMVNVLMAKLSIPPTTHLQYCNVAA